MYSLFFSRLEDKHYISCWCERKVFVSCHIVINFIKFHGTKLDVIQRLCTLSFTLMSVSVFEQMGEKSVVVFLYNGIADYYYACWLFDMWITFSIDTVYSLLDFEITEETCFCFFLFWICLSGQKDVGGMFEPPVSWWFLNWFALSASTTLGKLVPCKGSQLHMRIARHKMWWLAITVMAPSVILCSWVWREGIMGAFSVPLASLKVW